jgi:ribosome biogenesis GTPase A
MMRDAGPLASAHAASAEPCGRPEARAGAPLLPAVLTEEVQACIESLLALDSVDRAAGLTLQEKLRSQRFNLVVVGEFKRGKTSLINALIGSELLPTAVVPLTAIVTELVYGEAPRAEVSFRGGERQAIEPAELWEYVTESGNPGNAKGVESVRVSYPSSWLRGGVHLVDTPGIGSIHGHNTEQTLRYLPQADAVLMVLAVDQPAGEAEVAFLDAVREHADRVFLLLNKADHVSPSELEESLQFSQRILSEALGRPAILYPVSARLALQGRFEDSPEKFAESGFPAFSDALCAFLMRDKEAALLASVVRRLLRLAAQARFNREVEIKSLSAPIEELDRQLRLFEQKKQEVTLARSDYAAILDRDVQRLLKDTVEPDLAAFKAAQVPVVLAALSALFSQQGELRARRLHGVLEREVVARLKAAFDAWRAEEEKNVAHAFESACGRLAEAVEGTVEELLRFSSELFSVPFDLVRLDTGWRLPSRFYYQFWEEPVGLQMLTSSLSFALPRALGARLVLRRAQRYAVERADMQAGRIRYDFAQRLQESVREFRSAVLDRLEQTLDGIEAAVQAAHTLRSRGENALAEHRVRLAGEAQSLEEVRGRLEAVMARVQDEAHAASVTGAPAERAE